MKALFVIPGYEAVYGSYRHLYRKGFLNPPTNLSYLAASVISAGHEADIIDGEAERLSENDLVTRIREAAPDIIGMTATSIDFDDVAVFSEKIKQLFPGIKQIIGGTHINIFGTEVLESAPSFDYGCIGDGEDLIIELMEHMVSGGDINRIKGLLHRSGGQIIQNEHRDIETNLDRYPFPNRELLKNDLYVRAIPYRGYVATTAVMSSRGCPYSCIYCSVKNIYGASRVRLRSAASVLEEVEGITRDFGISHISFNDDCLTLNRNRMLEFCEGVHSRGLSFTWEGLSRADLVDRELLEIMHKAGFVRISFGIETGNPEILKVLQKKETHEQIVEAIRLAKEAGIVTRGSVIIGSPYETRETVEETFRFINRQKHLDQVVINILQPYPGTKVREMVLAGEGGTRFVGKPGESSKDLKRFGSSSVAVNDLTPEMLVKLQKKGFLRFYLRPYVILNNIRIAGMNAFMNDSWGFLKSIVGKS